MANPQIGFIILENNSLANQPTTGAIADLRANYRDFLNYKGTVQNPSLPDYVALSSGSHQGITSDSQLGNPGFLGTHVNVFHSIETSSAGTFSWKAYEEGVTGNYSAKSAGKFALRHCPAGFYSNTDSAGTGSGNGRFDFTGANGLVADIANNALPDFFFITPNLNNDAHDTTPTFAGQWLGGSNPDGNATPFLGITDLIQHMRPGGLICVTYDNVGSHGTQATPILMVVAGPGVDHTNANANTSYTHYSWLKGVGQVFGFADYSGGDIDPNYTSAAVFPLTPGSTGGGDTQKPNPPTTVTAVANSSSSITVSWSGATDNVGVTGYTVNRNGVAIATPGASPYTDNTGLSASTTYSYTILARDAAGNVSVASAAATATTQASADTTKPTVPTGLTASNVSSSTATLTWTPSTDTGGSGLAGYNVYKSGVLQSPTAASPTYSLTNLSPSTSYTFTVAAFDGAGNTSAQSTGVTFTTLAIVTGGSVAFRTNTDFNSGTTSVSVVPTSVVNGDTMLAHATAVGASVITPPSGWMLVGSTNDSTAISMAVYTKTAASEGTSTWTSAGATSLTVEISYVIGSCSVRVAGATNSGGTATVTTVGAALAGLSVNDEVCTWISSSAGPRPYPDTGCGFGFMTPHDWTSQAQVAGVESLVTRKITLAHHQVPWDCHVGVSNGDFSGSTQAPKVDYNNNRITYLSWPRQLAGANTGESSWNSVFGNGDPLAVFQGIQAGTYDALIDANATAYKTAGLVTGAHYIIRLFWEMNGGGVIFVIGKSANVNAYLAAYNPACQRIITRTKAIAKNVSFHWNPQNFQTTAISRDQLYWGDAYADFAGTELYTGSQNIAGLMTDTSSNGHTYPAIYTGYGPGSSHNKFLIAGEGGPQANHGGTTESDATVATRVQDYIDSIPNFPGLKQFTWWNGAGTGTSDDSIFADQGPLTLAKIKTLIASAYMSPNYTTTWKAVT